MALNLGFKKNKESYVSNSLPLLKPYGIYEVSFDGIEDTEVEGKKHPGEKYRILKIKFKNEDGQYQHSLFVPTSEKDAERRSTTNSNGHEVQFASNVEEFTLMIGHMLATVCPEALEKLTNSNKEVSYEQLYQFIKKATDPKIGLKTHIKLVGNSNGKAAFPKIASIFEKDGEAVITNNCIGDKLGFNNYELTKKEEFEKAKPTNMASTSDSDPLNESPIKNEEKDNLDFEL